MKKKYIFYLKKNYKKKDYMNFRVVVAFSVLEKYSLPLKKSIIN